MTWPLEMSRMINEYAGPFRFWDDADRDMIQAKERRVFDHINELRENWTEYITDNARKIADNACYVNELRRYAIESMDESDSDYDGDDDEETRKRTYNQFMNEHAEISVDAMTGAASGLYSFIATAEEGRRRNA